MTDTLGVIGVGNMGSALVKGWLRAGRSGLLVWDAYEPAVDRLLADGETTGGGRTSPPALVAADSLEQLAEVADTIVVVVKPKDAKELLGALRGVLRPEQTVVSAMAGLTLEWLREVLGPGPALFRVMPNLAVELGAGAVAVASDTGVAPAVLEEVLTLFGHLGLAEAMSEDLFDVFTAVSGSSPAFLALAIEGLEDGAVAVGLGRADARRVVREAALKVAQQWAGQGDPSPAYGESAASTGAGDEDAEDSAETRLVLAFSAAVTAAVERSRQMQKA